MAAVAIDSLEYARQLEVAGMPRVRGLPPGRQAVDYRVGGLPGRPLCLSAPGMVLWQLSFRWAIKKRIWLGCVRRHFNAY